MVDGRRRACLHVTDHRLHRDGRMCVRQRHESGAVMRPAGRIAHIMPAGDAERRLGRPSCKTLRTRRDTRPAPLWSMLEPDQPSPVPSLLHP